MPNSILMLDSEQITPAHRLLIVDDDPAVIEVLSILLEAENFEIETALSGETAIELLRQQTVNVLVTDIQMEGMTGFELIHQARALDSHVSPIVITAYDSYDKVRQALRLGAYDYLAKPLDNHELIISTIRRANIASQLERDNARLLKQLSASQEMLQDANTRLRDLNDELMLQASTDSLTKLYNRRYLDIAIESEVARRNRYPDPLSLVMLDIDRFKQFNDKYGHEGGDTALVKLGQILSVSGRNTDVVGRFGGEEFIILLPKTTPANALIYARRVRRIIETQIIDAGNSKASFTASIGVSGVEATDGDISVRDLLASADNALYDAKGAGRNCVRFKKLVGRKKAA